MDSTCFFFCFDEVALESAERGLMDDALGGWSGCDAVQKEQGFEAVEKRE